MKSVLRRITFDPVPVLVGLGQGLAIHLMRKTGGDGAAADGLLAFLFVGPTALILALDQQKRLHDMVMAGALGLVAGLLAARLSADLELGALFASPAAFPFSLCLFAVAVIALAFHKTRREVQDRRLPYDRLFHHAWDVVLTIILAGLFCGALWLVLVLWGALFKLIGITFFADLFGHGWFGWSFSGAAFGAGVVILRGLQPVVLSMRRLMITLFRLLGFILALAGILFLCALPFTGLQPLWDTRHASVIVLWVMLAMILFANAHVDGADEAKGALAAPVAVMLVLLPVYGLIALYSLWLRVAQYGLTPQRVQALLLVAVALLFAVSYAVAVVARRRFWPRAAARVNPMLALILALVAVLAHLPPLESYRLSAASQADRIRTGATASALDLGYLKFRLGAPGRQALAGLKADPAIMARADVAAAISEIDAITEEHQYWSLAAGSRGPDREAQIRMLRESISLYPEGAALPDDFLPAAAGQDPGVALTCPERHPQAPRCTAFRLDFNGDGAADIGLWDGYGSVTVYIRTTDAAGWRIARRLNAAEPLSWQDARQALIDGAVATAPPLSDDLVIGGTRFD